MEVLFFLKIKYANDKSLIRRFTDETITIGSSPFNNLHLPLTRDVGVHSIIEVKAGKFFITKLNLKKDLIVNEKKVLLTEILPNDIIKIDSYEISLLIPDGEKRIRDFKGTYKRIETINTSDYDKKIAKGFLASLLLTLIFLLTISFWNVPEEIPMDEISDRFSRLVIDPISTPNPIAKSMLSTDGEGEGKKLQGEEGTRGSKKAKIEVKGVMQIVRSKGVLGALNNKKIKNQLSKLLNAGFGFGNKFKKSLDSNNNGKKLALFKGSFGTGMKGTGGAGGGTSKDVVGGLATKGVGGGVKGYGKGSVGSRVASSIMPDEVNTVIKGSLDRSEIEAVIKRNLPQIRNCYEKELQTNPEISGKIVSFFIIGGNGYVTSSNIKETTMKNSSVELCVTRRIAKWIFPKPRGGGMVVVKYPFIFNSMKRNYSFFHQFLNK